MNSETNIVNGGESVKSPWSKADNLTLPEDKRRLDLLTIFIDAHENIIRLVAVDYQQGDVWTYRVLDPSKSYRMPSTIAQDLLKKATENDLPLPDSTYLVSLSRRQMEEICEVIRDILKEIPIGSLDVQTILSNIKVKKILGISNN